ncbi:unnamed protein product (macronuclear) [Paramecium tetraurelia]|uniref:t-SNARE coiled-coil homology domain-containing protein n=1 Tax=Paramecium tetraurelia TaxID=5888 RepID=A0CXM0_PARTE|nr:uncharacterized protein GSPATT00011169001 [Paramecium tetraurelia]CAK75537.1 unnamed protein product [Paramecium tetraurelia]|eukprot:XP_001442934.1 hypothetical protein (macronuclear) [Paramecium tetraurelia strain d4-2]
MNNRSYYSVDEIIEENSQKSSYIIEELNLMRENLNYEIDQMTNLIEIESKISIKMLALKVSSRYVNPFSYESMVCISQYPADIVFFFIIAQQNLNKKIENVHYSTTCNKK